MCHEAKLSRGRASERTTRLYLRRRTGRRAFFPSNPRARRPPPPPPRNVRLEVSNTLHGVQASILACRRLWRALPQTLSSSAERTQWRPTRRAGGRPRTSP